MLCHFLSHFVNILLWVCSREYHTPLCFCRMSVVFRRSSRAWWAGTSARASWLSLKTVLLFASASYRRSLQLICLIPLSNGKNHSSYFPGYFEGFKSSYLGTDTGSVWLIVYAHLGLTASIFLRQCIVLCVKIFVTFWHGLVQIPAWNHYIPVSLSLVEFFPVW